MSRTSSTARLVTVVPPSGLPSGDLVTSALTARAARRLERVEAHRTLTGRGPGTFATAMAASDRPSVVVPLTLAVGPDLRRELAAAAAASPAPVRVARPLGPHPLVAEAQVRRLLAAGARAGEPVVLVVDAGAAADVTGARDLVAAGRLLQARWGGPVRLATMASPSVMAGDHVPLPPALAAALRPVADVVADVRRALGRDGRVVLAPHLLAPGDAARRFEVVAKAQHADVVAPVLGNDPILAEVLVRRYREALGPRPVLLLPQTAPVVAAVTGLPAAVTVPVPRAA